MILMIIALILVMIDMSLSVMLGDWMRFTLEVIIAILILFEIYYRFDIWFNSKKEDYIKGREW